CMATVPTRDAAWTWVSAITSTIRAYDSSRPIVSGMHGGLDLWPPETLGELTDLLTTHPYPIWTAHCDQDPVNTMRTILHSTAESLFYAGVGGKPCLAEELGTLGPFIASDEIAADFVRSCLFSLWAHNCQGLLWWCAYDQEHLSNAPYDWNTCERELGLFRSNREAKPVINELSSYHGFLDSLPFDKLPPHPTEAVCLLSQDQDQWGVAYSAYILARQAGFEMEFQSAEQPLKPAGLYLVPSVRGVNVVSRRRWLELLERVNQGATLYLSLDDAILAGFLETFGLKPLTRRRRSSPVQLMIPGIGPFTINTAFHLTFEPAGATILGREADENPAFTCFGYGKGQVYFLSVPIERVLTETPGAFNDQFAQPWWKLYRLVAKEFLARRAVRKEDPLLGITEHALSDTKRMIVAINYSPAPLSSAAELDQGWKPGITWRGNLKVEQNKMMIFIPANDAVVFEIESKP
ncbi:MAG: beta-mannanase, partial [Anaerolineaceae bacterium]|nr:beta-mannanase [Anaerolineaceae bacterium]